MTEQNSLLFLSESEIEAILNDVSSLLPFWGFLELITDFQNKGIDLEALKLLDSDDLIRLILDISFGLRTKFRQKLFQWRIENGFPFPLTDKNPKTCHCTCGSSVPTTVSTSTNADSLLIYSEVHLNLAELLHTTFSGKEILKQNNESLSSVNRNALVNIICEFWMSKNQRPNAKDYNEAAHQIISLFPKESEDVYVGNKETRGKLVQKFYSLTKKYSTSDVHNTQKLEQTNEKQSNDQENCEDIESNEDYMWLKSNKTLESLVIDKWNATFDLRKKQMVRNIDLFEKWPILKQRIGSSLIELDFERSYPSKNVLLFSKWGNFSEKIISLYQKEVKDTKFKQLLKIITRENFSNLDSKNYLIIILLNAILIR